MNRPPPRLYLSPAILRTQAKRVNLQTQIANVTAVAALAKMQLSIANLVPFKITPRTLSSQRCYSEHRFQERTNCSQERTNYSSES